MVLAGSSPYLRAMFTNGMLESEQEFVEIHGIEASTMSLLLDFMYTCSIEVTVDNVQAVLQVTTWPSGKLPIKCQKIAKTWHFSKTLTKIVIFFNKIANGNFAEKWKVFGNFF